MNNCSTLTEGFTIVHNSQLYTHVLHVLQKLTPSPTFTCVFPRQVGDPDFDLKSCRLGLIPGFINENLEDDSFRRIPMFTVLKMDRIRSSYKMHE